jgi:hypothetical protein
MKLRILCKQHNRFGGKRKANAVIQIFRILISWRQSEETGKNTTFLEKFFLGSIDSTEVENISSRKKLGICPWNPRDFFTSFVTCLTGVFDGNKSTSSSMYYPRIIKIVFSN